MYFRNEDEEHSLNIVMVLKLFALKPSKFFTALLIQQVFYYALIIEHIKTLKKNYTSEITFSF